MNYIYKSILLAGIFFTTTVHAGLPVMPTKNQQELLQSSSPQLSHNKKIAFDFFRIVLAGRRLDQAAKFLRDDYIQHNPNVETGLKGFLDYFSKLGGPKAIPEEIRGLVGIQAEGDFVTLSFVNELENPKNAEGKYTTTWFDMFRIQDGKIAEHWDCDIKR